MIKKSLKIIENHFENIKIYKVIKNYLELSKNDAK